MTQPQVRGVFTNAVHDSRQSMERRLMRQLPPAGQDQMKQLAQKEAQALQQKHAKVRTEQAKVRAQKIAVEMQKPELANRPIPLTPEQRRRRAEQAVDRANSRELRREMGEVRKDYQQQREAVLTAHGLGREVETYRDQWKREQQTIEQKRAQMRRDWEKARGGRAGP